MDTYYSQSVGEVTHDSLKMLILPDLVDLYNEITGRRVVRFRDRTVALRRCATALETLFEAARNSQDGSISITAFARRPLNYPYRGFTSPDSTRRTSLQTQLFDLLKTDPTVQECLDLVGGSAVRLRYTIRNINRMSGYGIREEGGRLSLVEEHAADPLTAVVEKVPPIIEASPSEKGSTHVEGRPGVVVSGVLRMRRTRPLSVPVLQGCAVSGGANGQDSGGLEAHLPDDGGADPGGPDDSPEQLPGGSGNQAPAGPQEGDDDLIARLLAGQEEPRYPVRIRVTRKFIDRVRFLMKRIRAVDEEEVLIRALEYFDRAVCARIDHANITARHRSGTLEDFNP